MTDPTAPAAAPVDAAVPVAPEAAPAPLAPVAPTKSVLPLLSLIFAGVAFLFAFVLSGLAWIPAITAIVLAIVALAKRRQPKGLAIAAIIVAPIAWIISIIVATVLVFAAVGTAVDGAVSELTDSTATEVEGSADDEADEADAPIGTRENPAAIGSTIEGRDWTVVINSVTLDATADVTAENMFNDAPDEGFAYALVNYTATYTGTSADGEMPVWVGIEYVTPQGNTLDSTFVVAPGAIDSTSTLYSGASATGNTVVIVPIADGDQGVLAVRPGMIADKVFVAVK